MSARIPTVHLNGSSGDHLVNVHREALAALREFSDKLAEATPNARDFYVQGDNAFHHAQNEHAGRVAAVDKIQIELTEIMLGIHNQLDERAARRKGTP